MRSCLVAVLLLGLATMATAQMGPGGPPPGGPAPAMGAAAPAAPAPMGAAPVSGAAKIATAAGADASDDKPADAPSTSIVVGGTTGSYPSMPGSHQINRTAPYNEWPDPARVRGRRSAMTAELWIMGSKKRSSPDNKRPSQILVSYVTHHGREIAVAEKQP